MSFMVFGEYPPTGGFRALNVAQTILWLVSRKSYSRLCRFMFVDYLIDRI